MESAGHEKSDAVDYVHNIYGDFNCRSGSKTQEIIEEALS